MTEKLADKKEKKVEKEKQHVVSKEKKGNQADKKEKKVVVKVEKTDEEEKKKKKVETSNSEESKEKEANKAGASPKPKRDIKLAGSQKYPFVGNSTVKRIMKGIDVSPAQYDPLEPVDANLHDELQEFLKIDEEEPRKTKEKDQHFYLSLITPRSEWVEHDSGWLATGVSYCDIVILFVMDISSLCQHIAVAMTMFRNRHMCDISPFYSHRIAFLDAFFVYNMVRDYRDYIADQKKFVFEQKYRDNFSGLSPLKTNKKWFIDIDHLYACLFAGGNHWVALDIDLKKNMIFIYDSIPPNNDTKLLQDVRPIRKMIPAIPSEYILDTQRKKTCAMMDVRSA